MSCLCRARNILPGVFLFDLLIGHLMGLNDFPVAVCIELQCEKKIRCRRDRKSTRLNSSHQIISYAVFCLKKKKKKKETKYKINTTKSKFNQNKKHKP